METNLKKSKKNYKFIVYQTINLTNNKIYIGVHKTVNPDIFDGYLGCGVKIQMPSSYRNPTTPFQYAVKKYGVKNFRRTTLKVFDILQDAFDLERFLVDPSFLKRKDTYNACLGGGPGYRINYVHQFDFKGNLIKTWTNILEASEFYEVSHSAILNAVKFKSSSCGYFWSHSENIKLEEFTFPQNVEKIYMYDGGNLQFEKEFLNKGDAARYIKVTVPSIAQGVKMRYKVKNHYFSTTLYDEYPEQSVTLHIKDAAIYVYDLEGNFIREFKTGNEANKFFGSSSGVCRALKANRPYKGYQFSLEKLDKMPSLSDKTSYKKKVGRYSKTGDLLEVFDSLTAARQKYSTGVSRCVKGQQQFCKGFAFKYIS